MKRRSVLAAAVILLAVASGAVVSEGGPAAGATSAAAGVWGNAQEVPGLAALNTGGDAFVISVSCPAPGDCAASGRYAGSDFGETFVASEANGTWGKAQQIPGLAALAAAGSNGGTLSCPSAGNCAIAGSYSDASGKQQAFVADETGGAWGPAMEVPGLGGLNSGGEAGIESLSCASPGNCSAGGFYTDSSSHFQAFVVSEAGGSWGSAVEVPGTSALNVGGSAQLESLSCASPGNCSAGGFYTDNGGLQIFVTDEANGTWGTAQPAPGTATLDAGRPAALNSVSCSSAGNCSAGGDYTDSSGAQQAFVVDETNGTWGTAAQVPGMNSITSVSCAAAGNCTGAGGDLLTSSDHAYVVKETGGTWGTAAEVPGMSQLGDSDGSEARTVSCTASGYCSVGGDYSYPGGSSVADSTHQAFVADEANGTWGSAQAVPGLAALNAGDLAAVASVSCAAAGYCGAGGYYYDSSGRSQAFVVNETPPPPPSLIAVGVEGANAHMYVQAPQLGSGWHSLGGWIVAPPAVAAAPNPDGATPAQPLFIATGASKTLYIRSLTAGWQAVGPSRVSCVGGPAAVIAGGTLTVACRGTDNALWETTATVPATGLPRFTNGWKSLGGGLLSGPAVAPVGGTMTFFARGFGSRIYTRTLTSGWQGTGWYCGAAPAAALQAASSDTVFACAGTTATHVLWESVNGGAGWTRAVSLGGSLIGGPGIAATSRAIELLGERTDHAVWQRTPLTGWTSLGGFVEGGAAAAALN